MNLKQLATELREAAAKVTPGKWRFGLDSPSRGFLHANKIVLADKIYVSDGEYIALCSPENILTLITELERLMEMEREARDVIDGLRSICIRPDDSRDLARAFLEKYFGEGK